jgi:serine/threonine protein kinase
VQQKAQWFMSSRSGQLLGNYRLTRLLGQGGFADVYLGEHQHLETQAAIKILTGRLGPQEIQAFLREARMIAKLRHPHILRIFDFGIEDDTPYLIMEYAPHGNLRDRFPKGTRLPLSHIVRYIKQIAHALHYAHEAKIIHRDVKPENMLVSEGHSLLLSDFGAATIAHSAVSLKTSDRSGTPQYMAPEQFHGRPTQASDQYALGIVVYEWLCGRRPFRGDTFFSIGVQHITQPVPSLRGQQPTISAELERVVMKALAKDFRQRYPTILQFAAALEKVSQARDDMLTRPVKAVYPVPQVSAARVHTQQALLYREMSPSPVVHTTKQYEETPSLDLCRYQKHTGWVLTTAWSPDGRSLASAGWGENTIQTWDAQTAKVHYIYSGHAHWVNTVAWSPDGRYLASGGWDNTVRVWDTQTRTLCQSYQGHRGWIRSVAWSPDGKWIASGSNDNTVHVWSVQTGKLSLLYRAHQSWVHSVAWSPDGFYIASGSNDHTVHVWDTRYGKPVTIHRGHRAAIHGISWSPDGWLLASGSADNTTHVWHRHTGKHIFTYRGHSSQVRAVSWSPDGKWIASGGNDNTVQVWHAQTGKLQYIYRGHSVPIPAVAWAPDSSRIASACYEVHVWQVPFEDSKLQEKARASH